MSVVPRTRDAKRDFEASDRERFEVCEVAPTVHGDPMRRVLATAATVGGARLAAQTIQREYGIDSSRTRIYDTGRRRWLGPHLIEQREEP